MTNEEDIKYEPSIGDDAKFIDDDVDEDIIENEIIDDDDGMVDRFNLISESYIGIYVHHLDEDQQDT